MGTWGNDEVSPADIRVSKEGTFAQNRADSIVCVCVGGGRQLGTERSALSTTHQGQSLGSLPG